jgi:predicted ATP-dependent endonuclease of OLD family
MAPRIERLTVRNLRSVENDRVSIRFPEQGALVLLGENNTGKSNITRALDAHHDRAATPVRARRTGHHRALRGTACRG